MDIEVQSYRQVWHHKERADHLCWVFSLSHSDLVRIVEEPGQVSFIYRPKNTGWNHVDSGKAWKLIGTKTLFAVIGMDTGDTHVSQTLRNRTRSYAHVRAVSTETTKPNSGTGMSAEHVYEQSLPSEVVHVKDE